MFLCFGAFMRTTVDLPEALLIEAKVRAAREGRKLKEVIAEALDQGFAAMEKRRSSRPGKARIVVPEGGGLAYVACGVPPEGVKTPVEEILRLEQETLEKEDLQRAGIPD